MQTPIVPTLLRIKFNVCVCSDRKQFAIAVLNPTVDNPWDKIKYNSWKDKVTNICLGAAQAAFQTHENLPI